MWSSSQAPQWVRDLQPVSTVPVLPRSICQWPGDETHGDEVCAITTLQPQQGGEEVLPSLFLIVAVTLKKLRMIALIPHAWTNLDSLHWILHAPVHEVCMACVREHSTTKDRLHIYTSTCTLVCRNTSLITYYREILTYFRNWAALYRNIHVLSLDITVHL